MEIKSPFNFVSVSKDVFCPDWASQISQDVPFSDGLSGTIDLKIMAESPIFIRNGHTKEDACCGNDEYDSFSFVRDASGKKQYFIPATSIKGEVRSVLETISFGKLHVDPSARFSRWDSKNCKKTPYKRSVEECLSEAHRDDSKSDLAECIFGYSRGHDALKGRVQFGNAFAEGDVKEMDKVKLILASPKASYCPEYIRQSGGDYKTYDNGELAGRKRYYLRKQLWQKSADVNAAGEDKQNTTIRPLEEGAAFKSVISFHNLRPEELGALLSALTFAGGKTNRHQLGMAKPYGYGKCRYDVKLNVETSPMGHDAPHNDIEYYISLFEFKMDKWVCGKEWLSTPEIRELLALSSEPCCDTGDFQYMDLEGFADAKKAKAYLHPASELLKGWSFIRDKAVDNYKTDKKKALDVEAAEKQAAATAARKRKLECYDAQISNCQSVEECDKIMGELTMLKPDWAQFPDEHNSVHILINRCVSKKNEIQANEQKASQASQSFAEFFPEATSFGQWKGKIEKRKKLSNKLSKEDLGYAFEKLKEVHDKTYDKEKPVQKDKKWADGSYRKRCAKLVGEDVASKWFKKLGYE